MEENKMEERYSYNCPRGLMDGYSIIHLDSICTWGKCFLGYGGCFDRRPRFGECQLWDITKIIQAVKEILARKSDARIYLEARDFCDPLKMTGEERYQFRELLDEFYVEPLKVFFCVQTTPRNLIYLLEEEKGVLSLLFIRKVGIQEIWLGVESASPELRGKYSKPPFKNIDLIKATKQLQEVGIQCCWYLVASPDDTEKTIRQTVALVNEVKPDRIFTFDLFHYKEGERYVDLPTLQKEIHLMVYYQQVLKTLSEKIDKEGWK